MAPISGPAGGHRHPSDGRCDAIYRQASGPHSATPFSRSTDAPAPDAQAVARNLVLLLVAWAVLSQVMSSRWKGAIEEDERDREIATKAAGWGRAALVLCVIGVAVMLGFSPADKLRWASHFMIANMLVFALMWGWLVECVATTMLYLYDRRAAR